MKSLTFPPQVWRWYALALLVLVLDQISKQWVSAVLTYGEPVAFTPFFNFTLLHNPGAAFSFLSEAGGWQRWFFTILALGVSGVLVIWLAKVCTVKPLESLALALILGGALGNVYDRLTLGYVVDFIVVHYQDYYFPAFNIADSAITVGAFLLIFDMLFGKEKTAHD
jgi:signal peptidase II